MARRLYIIDGFAQIFRAYFAIRSGMQSPVTGEPTHAVFGFTGMLLKLLSQLRPDFVIVAMDAPGKTFRDELYSEYKATREQTPEDLTTQISRVIELIEAFGIKIIAHPGLEADDVIATVTERVLHDPKWKDVHIRIVSRDKDLEQLLSDRVTMYDIHKDEEIDVAALMENKGIRPDQVVDLLALIGDTVDNVPGVPGIGPKTAASLINEFGSIDGIFANIDKIKGKRRENLEAARETLPLSKELVTLKRDGDFDFSLEEAKVKPINLAKLIPLFQQLGFRRYQDEVRRLAGEMGEAGDVAGVDAPGGAGKSGDARGGEGDRGGVDELFPETRTAGQAGAHRGEASDEVAAAAVAAGGSERPADPAQPIGEYEVVTDLAGLKALVATLRQQPLISVDTETTSLGADARVCGLSFAWKEGHGVYVPTMSPRPDEHLDTETVLTHLREVLEDPALSKCGHNLKFDARVLGWEGVRLRGVVFDSMLASILLDPGRAGHKLDHLVYDTLGLTMTPISDLIGDGNEQLCMADVALEEVAPYAAEDADMTLRLYHAMMPRLKSQGLDRLLEEVEAPLTEVLAEMEVTGIMCDPEELNKQGELLKARVDELRAQIYEYAGEEFNIDSPRQLGEVLFEKLGLPVGKKTKTGYSTDIEVLTNLQAQEDKNDPKTLVPGLVIEYRQLTKLINTYLVNLREAISPKTKRIHTTFHQLVTATGRLASQNPNLQNIPVRTDIGRQVRKAFVAPPGHLLICADYSQIELRMLAHLSEDPGLTSAFQKGEDIHNAVAAQVYGVSPDQVSREQRDHAKVINFGIIYGITAYGLSRRIEGLDVGRAGELIADYKRRFPGIEAFLQDCIAHASEFGYVKTILGRRRSIPEISSRNRATRALGERLAINTVVQGSAADLIKVAMVNLKRRIDKEKLPVKLLLQIHDELVLEAPEKEAETMAEIVKDEMEKAMTLKVPLQAETGVGPDWMTAK